MAFEYRVIIDRSEMRSAAVTDACALITAQSAGAGGSSSDRHLVETLVGEMTNSALADLHLPDEDRAAWERNASVIANTLWALSALAAVALDQPLGVDRESTVQEFMTMVSAGVDQGLL